MQPPNKHSSALRALCLKGITLITLSFLTLSSLSAAVQSYSGNLSFSTEGIVRATLSPEGLALGLDTPSANLHVNGNAIVSNSVTIGSTSSSSANLEIHGTFSLSFQQASTNLTLGDHSTILADTSNGNLCLGLPRAENSEGRRYLVKNISTTNKLCFFSSDGIDGYDTITLTPDVQGKASIEFICGEGHWYITQLNGTLTGSSNLEGWWKFDDTTGTVMTDSGPNGHNGNLYGGLTFDSNTVTGIFGTAMAFDGVDDYAMVTSVGNPNPTESTLSFWIKVINKNNNDGFFTNNGTGFPNLIASGTSIRYLRFDPTPPSTDVSANYTLNEWFHFVVTASSAAVKLYINGVQISQDSTPYPTPGMTDTLFFMTDRYISNRKPQGYLDDVRFFSRVLNLEEIQALFREGENQL